MSWSEHKVVHKQIAADAWLYCTKRGKGRSTKMPEFQWAGELRPQPIGPTRSVSSLFLRWNGLPGCLLTAALPSMVCSMYP